MFGGTAHREEQGTPLWSLFVNAVAGGFDLIPTSVLNYHMFYIRFVSVAIEWICGKGWIKRDYDYSAQELKLQKLSSAEIILWTVRECL